MTPWSGPTRASPEGKGTARVNERSEWARAPPPWRMSGGGGSGSRSAPLLSTRWGKWWGKGDRSEPRPSHETEPRWEIEWHVIRLPFLLLVGHSISPASRSLRSLRGDLRCNRSEARREGTVLYWVKDKRKGMKGTWEGRFPPITHSLLRHSIVMTVGNEREWREVGHASFPQVITAAPR